MMFASSVLKIVKQHQTAYFVDDAELQHNQSF